MENWPQDDGFGEIAGGSLLTAASSPAAAGRTPAAAAERGVRTLLETEILNIFVHAQLFKLNKNTRISLSVYCEFVNEC